VTTTNQKKKENACDNDKKKNAQENACDNDKSFTRSFLVRKHFVCQQGTPRPIT
jgi:hypothetical protein